ncbi:MAG: hypothetical protein IH596_12560 [Bacteroidales bacterium]|nr:hypothetical protein [Bacteroidales bacterium]
MTGLKSGFLAFILVVISLPFFQKELAVVREPSLYGYFRNARMPGLDSLTWNHWFNESFQSQAEQAIEDQVGFRKSLIRIYNEQDYCLFGVANADGFIRGKKGYLYEEEYILEYTGRYFIGKRTIEKKLRKLKAVQEKLRNQGTELIMIIEPGKASFYPEYIPDHYLVRGRTLSNYDYMVQKCTDMQIPFLDLNSYFMEMKESSPYPLFPKYGMHWSIFGATLAVDTLNKYISKQASVHVPAFEVTEVTITDKMRSTDNDIEKTLNLIADLPETELAYPEIRFGSDTVDKELKMLVIGDSYYNSIKEMFSENCYLRDDFWYYNRKVYPFIHVDGHDVVHDDLRDRIQGYNVILLLSSEINLHCFFWNAVDQLYAELFPANPDSWFSTYENGIRNDRGWFRFAVKQAKENFTTLERMIAREAAYQVYQNFNTLDPASKEDSIVYYMQAIRSSPNWLADTWKKSKMANISLEEMMRIEAEYMYKMN